MLWTFQSDSGLTTSNAILFKSEVSTEGELSLILISDTLFKYFFFLEFARIESLVTSTSIKSLLLNEYDKKVVSIKLIPRQMGQLRIDGVVGKISPTNETANLWGKLAFTPIPIRSDAPATAAKPTQFDKKLEITVLPPVSALHVQFSPIPAEVIAGEIIPITVTLTNAGADALGDIYAAVESPRWILGDLTAQELPLSVLKGNCIKFI